METRNSRSEKIRRLTLAGLLTAIVVVLQLFGATIKFGIFSINLALVPIVIGAALLGVPYGAWFGFVNGVVILLSGDAAPFFQINVFGTIVTVLVKGMLCGLCAGLVFQAVSRWNKYAAVILAAIVCPVVNTGVFLIGCRLFFWDTVQTWADGAGFHSAASFAFLSLAGVNFLSELAINVLLAPAIAIVLRIPQNKNTALTVYGVVLGLIGSGLLIFAIVKLTGADVHGLKLFARYVFGQGLNLKQRYAVLALFSGLTLIGGVLLTAVGIRRSAKA